MSVFTERVLILGTNTLAWKIAELLAAFPHRYGIVGFVDDAYNSGGVLPRSGRLVLHNGGTTPISSCGIPGNGGAGPHNGDTLHHINGGTVPPNGGSKPGNGVTLPHLNGDAVPCNGEFKLGNGDGLQHNGRGLHVTPYPFPVIGPLDRIDNTIKDLRPHRIIVPLTEDSRLPVQALLNSRIEGVVVEEGNEVYERLARKLAIESLPPNLLIFSKDLRKPMFQMVLHRAISLAFAALGLLLTAPLMGIIAVAIKVDSRGPVFFIQEREGYRGRVFRLIKFRTMHPSSIEEGGWSRELSSRITRVGKWLRKFRLDEFPQFINVLQGDMDVVGPRPEMACNVKTMGERIAYYPLRTMVRPGITGWAQIRHGYALSEDDVTEKIRFDLYYIKHMSLWFDLRILMETVKIVLFGHGAQ